MTEIQAFLHTVERVNAIFAGVALIVGFVWLGASFGYASLVTGLLVGAVNFRAIGWVARRIATGTEASRAGYTLLFVGKLFLLMVLCYVLVVLVAIEVLPFLVGVSTIPVALLGGAWWQMVAKPAAAA